ncbi:TBC1 domain family member 12 [Golovinomyces cichoracearum]|uniref:TBC1 domain family member 12 n=1 Tax=Golovinomyces cichoracearum TaxID=62708 RepID=A0A420IH85_9PEZI|nr:TBC1 domain family member 12 [Golovinomyces cichoracearum]
MTGLFDSAYTYSSRQAAIPRSPLVSARFGKRESINGKSRSFDQGTRSHITIIQDGPSSAATLSKGKQFNLSPLLLPEKFIQKNQRLSPMRPDPSKSSVARSQSGRSVWQIKRSRKIAKELEIELDNDDDEVPDDCFLENVPISPRPHFQLSQRVSKNASSTSGQPNKCRIKPLGNGTSAQPTEQGQLRSPRFAIARKESIKSASVINDQFKIRTMSWGRAMSHLSQEMRDLTEALEEYSIENRKTGSDFCRPVEKPRVKSASAELPPLRRTEIMVDPFPVSREKEAFLSRTRPSWLPPKDPTEEKRHLREYKRMMARSLEADRKKEEQRRGKTVSHDDTSSFLLQIWEEHVLPNWDTAVRQKRTKDLWWKGIPPRKRGKVWMKAIGNELELSEKSYAAALRRVQELEAVIENGSQLTQEEVSRKAWLDRIKDDVKKTYPELKIFQPDGPLYASLLDVLKAYTMYRSDLGYISGTSTSAALLLLNLPTPCDAFITLANLLNRPLPLAFYTLEPGAMEQASALLSSVLKLKSSGLHTHLTSLNVISTPENAFRDFFTSLGTAYMNLDNATRLWDIMIFERDSVLIRAAVIFLMNLEFKLRGAASHEQALDIIRGNFLDIGEEEWINTLRKICAES